VSGAGVIAAQDVSKVFDLDGGRSVTAIEGLNRSVGAGECVCLVGGSGCGKTTFLNMVAGFLQPPAGQLLLHGPPITTVEPRCGMMFQQYALFPWKTVQDNVEFGLKMRGVDRRTRRETAERYINLVNLEGFQKFYPVELSGGMQQRVTLARMLANDPEVFLMDEPFAALDAMTRQVMQEELIRIHEQSGKTTVFVTHNIDEAILLSDRIVVMSSRPGRVKASIENTLPRPRKMDVQLSPEFVELKSRIWGFVEEEVRRHIASTQHAGAA
jgi:NitT/TauT family transport system ATP-binding protein